MKPFPFNYFIVCIMKIGGDPIGKSSIVVDGVDEPSAEFVDNYTERPFYIVLRTGHILSDKDEFSL